MGGSRARQAPGNVYQWQAGGGRRDVSAAPSCVEPKGAVLREPPPRRTDENHEDREPRGDHSPTQAALRHGQGHERKPGRRDGATTGSGPARSSLACSADDAVLPNRLAMQRGATTHGTRPRDWTVPTVHRGRYRCRPRVAIGIDDWSQVDSLRLCAGRVETDKIPGGPARRRTLAGPVLIRRTHRVWTRLVHRVSPRRGSSGARGTSFHSISVRTSPEAYQSTGRDASSQGAPGHGDCSTAITGSGRPHRLTCPECAPMILFEA